MDGSRLMAFTTALSRFDAEKRLCFLPLKHVYMMVDLRRINSEHANTSSRIIRLRCDNEGELKLCSNTEN
jgi:hypothetical protein